MDEDCIKAFGPILSKQIKKSSPPAARVDLLAYRYENSLDLWTGKPLKKQTADLTTDD